MSFVIKKSNSAQGKGIYRAFDIQHCSEQLSNINKHVVIQEFCDMGAPVYDMRLMLVGTNDHSGISCFAYVSNSCAMCSVLAKL